MKTFALIALVGVSSAVELSGYTIDLCPDAIGIQSLGSEIYLPGNEELLALAGAWKKSGMHQSTSDIAYEIAAQQKLGEIQRMREF